FDTLGSFYSVVRFAGLCSREGAKIFGKPLFISFPPRKKSAFISWQSKRGFALSNLICPSIV
ncbi:hypothetical protein, partial [Cloacibacillus porcorum]|uniref:hypothetical protein n=1 Tax=Cloacibacillus porcorum TaxID=1197717 RepID=UPI003F056396